VPQAEISDPKQRKLHSPPSFQPERGVDSDTVFVVGDGRRVTGIY